MHLILSPFPRVDSAQDCVQVCSEASSRLQLRSAVAPTSEPRLQLSSVQDWFPSKEEGLILQRRGPWARRGSLRPLRRGPRVRRLHPRPDGQQQRQGQGHPGKRSQVVALPLTHHIVIFMLFYLLVWIIQNTTTVTNAVFLCFEYLGHHPSTNPINLGAKWKLMISIFHNSPWMLHLQLN